MVLYNWLHGFWFSVFVFDFWLFVLFWFLVLKLVLVFGSRSQFWFLVLGFAFWFSVLVVESQFGSCFSVLLFAWFFVLVFGISFLVFG